MKIYVKMKPTSFVKTFSTAPMDYTETTMTVVFGPEESVKTVLVPIEDDDVLEGLEMFSAILTTSDIRVQLFNSSASVTITDNDGEDA